MFYCVGHEREKVSSVLIHLQHKLSWYFFLPNYSNVYPVLADRWPLHVHY